MLVHGEPRLTKDIDVTLDLPPFDPEPVLDIVQQLGLRILVSDPQNFIKQTFVLPTIDDQTDIRVDLICSLSEYEREAIQRCVKVNIGAASVNFIGLEDLLIHKVIAGRPRDEEDVKSVLLKNKKVDISFVRKWLNEYDALLDTDYGQRFEGICTELKIKT